LQDARRYRELEKENTESKKLLANAMLKIQVLIEGMRPAWHHWLSEW
jgi:hypothetical protein